jgi:acetyl esterase/lipase
MTEDQSVLSRSSAKPDATISYGLDAEQIADVRYGRAADAANPLLGRHAANPLLIIIHGGFWRPAYDRAHTGPMADALAKAGFTVASIEYRRLPGQPQATLDDVALALKALPGKIDRHDGRVILIGHSAGGHLVLWLAAAHDRPELAGVVALAPAADLRLSDRLNLGSGAVRAFLGGDPETHQAADPARLATPRAPITIVHGEQDDTVPLEVARAYVTKHPTTRLVALPGTGHFAVIDPLSAAWARVVEEVRSFSAR